MIHRAKKSLGLKKFSKENFSPETSFFKTKKSLGQNFLKSEPALRMMCEAGEVSMKDMVLEIGPGKGALTTKLLEKAQKVIAVEKDFELVNILKEKFALEIKENKLILLHEDILKYDIKLSGIKEHQYKIISNIPYNITGAIIKRFLSETIQPNTMVLLVQKEVAERIVARDNKESILSLSVKIYGEPKYIMKVGKRFFSPSPKVDSAIIAIKNINRDQILNENEHKFFEIIKAAFAHKRKVLRKNLEDVATPVNISNIMNELNLSPMVRAEDVQYPVWLKITKAISKYID